MYVAHLYQLQDYWGRAPCNMSKEPPRPSHVKSMHSHNENEIINTWKVNKFVSREKVRTSDS